MVSKLRKAFQFWGTIMPSKKRGAGAQILTGEELSLLTRMFNVMCGGEVPTSETDARDVAKRTRVRWASGSHSLEVASILVGGLENNARGLSRISGSGVKILEAFLGELATMPLTQPGYDTIMNRLTTIVANDTAAATA